MESYVDAREAQWSVKYNLSVVGTRRTRTQDLNLSPVSELRLKAAGDKTKQPEAGFPESGLYFVCIFRV